MITFVVSKGKSSFEEFERINGINPIKFEVSGKGGNRIAEQINDLLTKFESDFLVLSNSDLVLPDGWVQGLPTAFESTQKRWESCAALTAVGIASVQHGYGPGYMVDHLVVAGYESLSNLELPVTSSSSEFVVMDLRMIRSAFPSGISEFKDDEFHVWFCLMLALAGLHVIASPVMATFMPNRSKAHIEKPRKRAQILEYVGENLNVKEFLTTQGPLGIPLVKSFDLSKPPRGLVDLFLGSVTVSGDVPSLSIVTRTQYGRLKSLGRCLESIMSFASHYDQDSLNLILVSDKEKPEGFKVPERFQTVLAKVDDGKDSRFLLAGEVVAKVKSDYYLFVDDDDWMFPNNAILLRETLRVCPSDSIIFADARHYHEVSPEETVSSVGSDLDVGRFFPANQFLGSLGGVNKNPFCAVVLPRLAFEGMLSPEDFSRIEFAEDYFLTLRALYKGCLPVILEGELAGISIRSSGNTVTEFSNVKWVRAKANVANELAQSLKFGRGGFLILNSGKRGVVRSLPNRVFRALFDGRLIRFALQTNVLGRILRREISIKFVISKVFRLVKNGW